MTKKNQNDIAQPTTIPDAMDEKSWTIFGRIIAENYQLNKWVYPAAFVCLIVVAVTSASLAWLMKDVVNEVLLAKDRSLIFWVSGSLSIIYIVRGLANFGQKVLMGQIGNSIVATYQDKIYRHLLKLDLDYFNELQSGHLVGQINLNIAAIRNLINIMLSGLTRDAFTVIGLFVVMITLEPVLTAMSFLVFLIGGAATQFLVRRMKSKTVTQAQAISKVASKFQETVQNIDILKAFTLEERFKHNTRHLIDSAESKSNSYIRTESSSSPIMDVLAGLSIGAFLVLIGFRSASGNVNPGSFFAFITALIMLYDPIRRLINLRVSFEGVITNARMLQSILNTPVSIKDKPDSSILEVKRGEIRFENVCFDYSNDKAILRNTSLVAKPGEMTALVGSSGSGKSTILNLILRFYEIESGHISIDGQTINEVTINSLRRSIAYVSQNPVLFEGTVYENIAYGADHVTQKEIEDAAKSAFADHFIQQLPQGYNTPLGENGVNLSGGQRQRLAIARAIVRNAPILLLDEATSALDTESEAKVQKAIDALVGDRTTLVIAHRLSTVAHADQIYVLEAGQVVEAGKHDDLISKNGPYSQFYNLQAN